MSTNSLVYFNLKGKNKTLDREIALVSIQKSINKIVTEHYDEFNIKDHENSSRFPLIRNASKLDRFDVRVSEILNKGHSYYQGQFNIFCSEADQAGMPKQNFRRVSSDFDEPRQLRTISILIPTVDIKHHIENGVKFNEEKDSYISISLGDDNIGRKVMKQIADDLSENFKNHNTYYIETDLNDNIVDLTKKEKRKRVAKP